MRTMKGQGTIVGIIMSVICFILVSIMMPVIYPFVNIVQNQANLANDTTTSTMVGLFPPVLQLMALMGPIAWTWFNQQNNQMQQQG